MSEMDRNNGGFAPFQSELEGGQEPLGQVDYSLETLLKKVKEHSPLSDMEKITKAYHFSEKAHEGQKRRSGEPYFIHPVTVAGILAELGMDTDSIVAGLLHDCLEDTSATYTTLEKEFGRSVADLVNGVTRLGKIVYSSKEEAQMEDLRKMFIAMARDIRVIIIKLADRLHNARTFQYLPEQKQRDKALETMEIYAPLAHRLGIQNIKWELEDISIKYLDPVGYGEIMSQMADKGQQYEDFLQGVKKRISEKLLSMGIPCEMKARVKHVYSIYRKMYTQNLNLSEIYDICAVRVIVEELADCYNVLGFIHDLYRPVPGRFKDYISTPKPNGYQSLHTVVIGREGIPFEVQIRTREMDRTAEYGVAAHWKYKDGLKGKQNEETFAWIRQLLESQQDTQAEDFIQNIKVDLFSDEVFVFTPKGDVINLPAGATPIDFAYAIHSAVGNRMVGAKVNGRLVPIDYELKNGEIVEVVTSKETAGPKRDWLQIAKTAEARNKIKQWFEKRAAGREYPAGPGCAGSGVETDSALQRFPAGRSVRPGASPVQFCRKRRPLCQHRLWRRQLRQDPHQGAGRSGAHQPAEKQERSQQDAFAAEAGHQRQRRHCGRGGQLPGEVLQVLYPHSRRQHRGLCHPGLWRVHPPHRVPQCGQGHGEHRGIWPLGAGGLGPLYQVQIQHRYPDPGQGPGGYSGGYSPGVQRDEDQCHRDECAGQPGPGQLFLHPGGL